MLGKNDNQSYTKERINKNEFLHHFLNETFEFFPSDMLVVLFGSWIVIKMSQIFLFESDFQDSKKSFIIMTKMA